MSVPWKEIKVGDELEFSLMRRQRNSLFAVAVDDYRPEINAKHPNVSDALKSHSQLVLASPMETASSILAREYRELLAIGEELGDDPTICYVQEALKYLSERKGALTVTLSSKMPDLPVVREVFESEVGIEEVCRTLSNVEVADDPFDDQPRPRHASSSSEGGSSIELEDEDGVTAKDLDLSSLQSVDGGK